MGLHSLTSYSMADRLQSQLDETRRPRSSSPASSSLLHATTSPRLHSSKMGAPTLPSRPVLLNYEIREQLASGGMSTVYRALHLQTRSLGAIKIVPLRFSAPAQELKEEERIKAKQVMREMRIQETLSGCDMVLRLWGGEWRKEEGTGVIKWPEGLWMLLDLGERAPND